MTCPAAVSLGTVLYLHQEGASLSVQFQQLYTNPHFVCLSVCLSVLMCVSFFCLCVCSHTCTCTCACVCLYMCVPMYMCVGTHVCTCMCLYVHMWRSRATLGVFLNFSSSFLLRHRLSLNLELAIQLDQLTRAPRDPQIIGVPAAGPRFLFVLRQGLTMYTWLA